ncbi:phospholipase A [Acinetobacter sp. 194]|uniref:phospholipase A n=1 Tax=Acinetobacter shaoyimingii TaxID=2715164 RepID=UPI00140BA5EC|nr:phospholipase A [Acinetobacter shaoyimingii]NHB58952.1 phospholipase A [Acinetobacter shaoyimingii]
MPFKHFERTPLNLSIFLMLNFVGVSVSHAEDPSTQINPASSQACVALESNADRLACYDALFKIPNVDSSAPVYVSEQRAAKEIEAKEEPKTLANKIENKVENLFSVHAQVDPNSSLLDKRWELSEDSKLGTWNIRAHQPVYLMPAFWTSKKNEFPHSQNPNNTVTDDQNLKSLESKFQISLKTKALENLIGNNGDLWLGYTQSSRWQVYNGDESRPFRETNYEPEASLVFHTNYNILGLNGRLLGLTLNHQSNGRSDPLSRSWNRVMLNVGFERGNFAMMVRPWYRIEENAEDDNNPDIKNYIGRGDLTTFYRWNDHDFSLMLRHSLKGGDDSRGAVQFDWVFPIKGKLRGHFQVFDGYGESLIDYNHRATYIGLGASLMNAF